MSEGEKYSEACILKTNQVKAGGGKLYFVQMFETSSAKLYLNTDFKKEIK